MSGWDNEVVYCVDKCCLSDLLKGYAPTWVSRTLCIPHVVLDFPTPSLVSCWLICDNDWWRAYLVWRKSIHITSVSRNTTEHLDRVCCQSTVTALQKCLTQRILIPLPWQEAWTPAKQVITQLVHPHWPIWSMLMMLGWVWNDAIHWFWYSIYFLRIFLKGLSWVQKNVPVCKFHQLESPSY